MLAGLRNWEFNYHGLIDHFHHQMQRPSMVHPMAQAVGISLYKMSTAVGQRLPYMTAPMTGTYLVVVTMRWLSFVK